MYDNEITVKNRIVTAFSLPLGCPKPTRVYLLREDSVRRSIRFRAGEDAVATVGLDRGEIYGLFTGGQGLPGRLSAHEDTGKFGRLKNQALFGELH